MGDWTTELTGCVLVLVAHADDECVGYGALLQRMRKAVVVITTDGAPRDAFFWERFGSREDYRAVRRDEARRAMEIAGVHELVLLADEDERLEDQRLFLNLPAAYARLEHLSERVRPEAIATLAYEGGHPDHDSCSVLGAKLGAKIGAPVWEAPLYHRGRAGIAQGEDAETGCSVGTQGSVTGLQQFICESGGEVRLEITSRELERKCEMCAQYASQGDFLQTFDARREVLRRQIKYEYGQPPHVGPTNYEQWQWWMSAREVSAKLAEFLRSGD